MSTSVGLCIECKPGLDQQCARHFGVVIRKGVIVETFRASSHKLLKKKMGVCTDNFIDDIDAPEHDSSIEKLAQKWGFKPRWMKRREKRQAKK